MQRVDLYNPLLFGGLKSAQDPLALQPGDCSDLKNHRKDVGGASRVREGISTSVAGATGLATGVTSPIKGLSPEYDDGTYVHVLLAWKETADNDVHIYHRKKTKSSGVWGNWAQLTADSGKFGDTALTDPKNGYVNFVWCEVTAGARLLVGNYHTHKDAPVCLVSDGTSVRIVDLYTVLNGPALGDTDTGLGHANAIPPPKGNLGVSFDAYDWLDVRNAAVTPSGSGAGEWGTVAQAGSAGARRWEFTTGTVSAGGSTAYIAFDSEEITYSTYTSDTDYFTPNQIWLIAHSADSNFWQTATGVFRWKTSAGAYATASCPSKPLVLPTTVDDYEFVVYDLPDQLPEQAADLLMNGFGFTTGVETPSTNLVKIYAIGVGGASQLGTEYGIARRSTTTNVHSPGVVLQNTAFKVKKSETRKANTGILDPSAVTDLNGTVAPSVYTYATLPADFYILPDSRVYATARLSFSNPHTGELSDNAADGVVIYRKEPGESDFFRVDRYSAAQYATSGGWSYASGSASSTLTYTDTVASEYREYGDRLPDEACAPPGKFVAGMNTNGRTFLAEDFASGTNLRISEYNQPLRLVDGSAQSPDSKSGFNIRVSRESGRAIFAGNSGGPNASIYLGTDKSVYDVQRLQGDNAAIFYLRKVSERGVAGPLAVCEVEGELCWMDKDRDVRIAGRDVSRTTVSDEFYAIPDAYLGLVSMSYHNGRLRVAYPGSAATDNTLVLVYNSSGQYWEGYDTLPANKEPQVWLQWRVGNEQKLYFVADTGIIYEYEKSGQTTDAGTAISFLIETGEYHNNRFDPVVAESIGVVADKVSVTLATVRTETQSGSTESGTLDLSTGGNRTWKWDTTTGKSGIPGIEGAGIRLKISGDFSVACKFYAIVADMDGGTFGGAER